MLLFLFFLSTCFKGYDFWTTKTKCASAYLSIGAVSYNITINWSLNCTKDTRPDSLVFYVNSRIDKTIDLNKQKNRGFLHTGIRWDYKSFAGYWTHSPVNPLTDPSVCYPYRLRLFRRGHKVYEQCLFIHPNWMSRFKDSTKLRIGEIFIPGTYGSFDCQNFNIWGQLVFGMRYFDINVAKVAVSKIFEQLTVIETFLRQTKKEIIILDFNGFTGYNETEHEKLVNRIINFNFKQYLAIRDIGNHPKGPLLRLMWETNMRIIVNYRDGKTVKKYNFLWNDIFVKDGKKKTVKGLKDYIFQVAKLPYKPKMSALVARLHSDSSTSWDRRVSADKLNPQLSDWYFDKMVMPYVNIFIVNYFESSKLHMDCFRVTKKKSYIEEQGKN